MDKPYQLILDIWEGNPDLDVDTLLANDVIGCIVRLNDMLGGHHMDAGFTKLWALAQRFVCKAIYFVYNPWSTGSANFNWLLAHMPAGYTGRLFTDIEVRYSGYSPMVYAQNVDDFITRCTTEWNTTIYTGEWFLPNLTLWPMYVDYWWGAYPNKLTTGEHISWDEFRNRLSTLTFAFNGSICPGGKENISQWQCSGGGVWMPGFLTRPVDVSVFPGTLEECKAYYNEVTVPPVPQPVPNPRQRLISIASELNGIAGMLD